MKRSAAVRVVSQRKSWDCGVACLAMFLDRPYGDVMAEVRARIPNPRRDGLIVWHVEAIADAFGVPLRRVYRQRNYLVGATGILGLIGEKLDRSGHWVIVKDGLFIDPDGAEVWTANEYLRKHRARPCTLLVRAEVA